ncbi:unnamed protein product [Lactuca saligna]|uniref:Uncharacterized protein n=1 Tax=Lactuca saligna TaxID=75948 RepID=A0AA35YI17_LACSI|nr:unnamed protein product [Lactuca saligna]
MAIPTTLSILPSPSSCLSSKSLQPIHLTCPKTTISLSKSNFTPFSIHCSNPINLASSRKPISFICSSSFIVSTSTTNYEILWLNPMAPMEFTKNNLSLKKHHVEFVQYRVSVVASELLSQNNRRQFAHPSYFHADGVNVHFISQALIENTRAYDILKQAPFLVPFTSRVKLFTGLNQVHHQDYYLWYKDVRMLTFTIGLHLMISSPNLISTWFCPVAYNRPLKYSPILMYLPGLEGTGTSLVVHEKALGK